MIQPYFKNTTISMDWKALLLSAGLCLFAVSAWLSTAFAYIGLGIILISVFAQPSLLRRLKKDRLIRLSILFLIYIVIRTLVAGMNQSGTWSLQFEEAKELLEMGFFIIPIISYALIFTPVKMRYILGLALLSFLLAIMIYLFSDEAALFFRNTSSIRVGAGMNPNIFGVHAAIALSGWIVFYVYILTSRKSDHWFVFRYVLWLLLFAVLVLSVFYSQSRGALLSIFIAIPMLLCGAAIYYRRRLSRSVTIKLAWTAGVVVLCFIALIFFNHDLLKKRLPDPDHLHRIISGQLSGLDDQEKTISVRFHLLRRGWEFGKARPLFGWGPGGTHRILDEIDTPEVLKLHPDGTFHFHNSYMETFIQTGFVGILFFAVFIVFLFRGLLKGLKSGVLKPEIFWVVLGGGMIFLIASFAELQTGNHFGQFFIYLFGGIAYSGYLRETGGDISPDTPQTSTAA